MLGCIKAIVWSVMVILLGCVLVTGFTMFASYLQLYGGDAGRFIYSSLDVILAVCFLALIFSFIVLQKRKRR